MAYVFGASTDKIDHGSPTALDDQAQLTLLGWVYPTTIDGATFRPFAGKGVNTFFTIDNESAYGGSGSMRCRVVYSVGNIDYYTTTGVITLNSWQFLAYTLNTGGSNNNRVKFYRGAEAVAVAEQANVFSDEPNGSRTSDASASLAVGNIVDAYVLVGRVAGFQAYPSVLTLSDIEEQRLGWTRRLSAQVHCRYNVPSGGTQVDQSGNGNNGTVTGATFLDDDTLRWRSFGEVDLRPVPTPLRQALVRI